MSNALAEMQADLSEKLQEVESICKAYGLPIDRVALVVRQRDNDRMSIVLGNETPDDAEGLIGVIRKRMSGEENDAPHPPTP